MKMNRRGFFRFFGRASGTAAVIVVGGAALLPKVTGAVELIKRDGSTKSVIQMMDPLDELGTLEFKTWHARAVMRKQWSPF